MKTYINPVRSSWKELCERPSVDVVSLDNTINEIFKIVKDQADNGITLLNEKYDGYVGATLRVDPLAIEASVDQVDEELKNAIQLAYANIKKFHESQDTVTSKVETTEGVVCWQEYRAIERVGLYIPGGTAPLFSTVLMLGIPAQLAGCKEVILCTPPDKMGNINPIILYAAHLVGITKVYRVGGAQAIAAMSLGTESIPVVNKVFGPGNQYVTAAKQKAQSLGVAIDMPAGPSELLVLAGDNAVPKYVASDLLSQAEHGADSQVLCIVENEEIIQKIQNELVSQLNIISRKAIASKALTNSKFIYFEQLQDRIDFINEYAPEHYIICSKDEDFYVNGLVSAGSVFIGNYTPESAGDYASGTNHTLPTSGYAKSYSGVNLESFRKRITFQRISKLGIKKIGPTIEIMAKEEQLEAHANAVSIRLKDLNVKSKIDKL